MTMSTSGRKSLRGFTMSHLLVVIGIIAFIVALLLPSMLLVRERNNRIKCASNLKQIGFAMMFYCGNEKNGGFPRVFFQQTGPGANVVDLTDAGFVDQGTVPVDSFSNANNPSIANLPANSVGGSLFLLLKTQDLTREVFICPSSNGIRGFQIFSPQNSNNFGGWGSASQANAGTETIPDVSYSYTNPFPSTAFFSVGQRYRFNNTLGSEFALVADVNPGAQTINGMTGSPATVNPGDEPGKMSNGDDRAFGNSINHKNQGQNVLYGDCHVEFQRTCWCGEYRNPGTSSVRDNIYTNGTQSTAGGSFGVDALPRDQADSVCLPTSN